MVNFSWFMSCTFFISLGRQNVGEVFTGETGLGGVNRAEGASLRGCRCGRRRRPGLGTMFFLLSFPGKEDSGKDFGS